MTFRELENSPKYAHHHRASKRGYVSRKYIGGVVKPYSGRFGEGYIVEFPRWDTTQFIYVDYYINIEKE